MNTHSPTAISQSSRAFCLRAALTCFFFAALAIAAMVLLAGCGTIDRALYRSEVKSLPPQIISTNITYTTNVIVLQAASTNATTGEVTPAKLENRITPQVTYSYAPPVTVTNLVPRPEVEGITKAVGIAPFPFASTVAFALTSLYGAYAAVRNRKQGERLGAALVKSVQAGREFLQQTPDGQKLDQKFTEILASHQDAAGVLDEVRGLINDHVKA